MTSSFPVFGRRILILIPHPDDEIVGFCAAALCARAQGAKLFGLFLTHGCSSLSNLWPWQRKHYHNHIGIRLNEAHHVAAKLNLTLLNTPTRDARYLWRELSDVYLEIQEAIHSYTIDQLWVPAYEGGNADHDALNGLSSYMADHIDILEFAEYNFCGGKVMNNTFPYPNGTETVLTLNESEQAFKRECLSLYASEKSNLNYVTIIKETFRPLAEYNYGKPAHEGKLWYKRFNWVPFHHPRVDRTNPLDVCAAIEEFALIASVLPGTARKSAPEHRGLNHDNDE
ncbi:MAG: PIG-L family deacetylase [Alphaproteobacteria bacterium]|jgi:LmbE family N-acetylglucosaminyl deacetylase|nr:PIG-L family deacetylase [Alphaproteobacteria bacterium]